MSGHGREKDDENQHRECLLEYILTAPCPFKRASFHFFLPFGLPDVRIPSKNQAGFAALIMWSSFRTQVLITAMPVATLSHCVSLSRKNTGALLLLGLDKIYAFNFFIVVKYA